MTLNVGAGPGCLCGKTDPTCLYAGGGGREFTWGAGCLTEQGLQEPRCPQDM